MIDAANIAWITGSLGLVLSFFVCRRSGTGTARYNASEENRRSPKGGLLFGHELPAIGSIVLLLFGLFLFISDSPWNSVFFVAGSAANLIFTGSLLKFFSGDLQSKSAGDDLRAPMRSGIKFGLFTGSFSLLSLGALYRCMPADAPETWILFGFGVCIIPFIRKWLNRKGRPAPPIDQAGKNPGGRLNQDLFRSAAKCEGQECAHHSERIADQLSELYTVFVLSFCILMGASLFIEEQLPDWDRIAPLLASAGLAASVFGIGLRFLLGGKCTGPAAAVTGALYSGSAFYILKGAADGITSQVLADMSILDRMGPFWAVAAGIFSVLLTHVLYCRYQKANAVNEKNQYLLGRAERIYFPLLFPAAGVWIAYESAGLYGIVLSAVGAAGVLSFLIFPDLNGADRNKQTRSLFFTGLREPSGSISFFAAAGCLSLIPLYAAELGTAAGSGALEIAGAFFGIGLGIAHPFLIRKLAEGAYWKSAVLPIFAVLSFVLLVGGLPGLSALLGFLAATLCTETAYLIFDLYRRYKERSEEESYPDSILAKTAASAALALLPLIVLIYESTH